MTLLLYPGTTHADHEASMRDFAKREDAAVFVAERPGGQAGGFVEVSTRAYADGCDTSPVGYIEAWYVDEDLRRSGAGRALLEAAESWARRRGYREMASDALLDNDVSHRAHLASGYAEVERAIRYRKPL